jgi:hypothetical protein
MEYPVRVRTTTLRLACGKQVGRRRRREEKIRRRNGRDPKKETEERQRTRRDAEGSKQR